MTQQASVFRAVLLFLLITFPLLARELALPYQIFSLEKDGYAGILFALACGLFPALGLLPPYNPRGEKVIVILWGVIWGGVQVILWGMTLLGESALGAYIAFFPALFIFPLILISLRRYFKALTKRPVIFLTVATISTGVGAYYSALYLKNFDSKCSAPGVNRTRCLQQRVAEFGSLEICNLAIRPSAVEDCASGSSMALDPEVCLSYTMPHNRDVCLARVPASAAALNRPDFCDKVKRAGLHRLATECKAELLITRDDND